MREKNAKTGEYCVVILKAGPDRHRDDAMTIIGEHVRRNFALRNESLLSIFCPITDSSHVSGIGIFNAPFDRVHEIMEGDPAVQEGLFIYQVPLCRSFPKDRLPG